MELLNRNTVIFLHSYWGEANTPVTISNHYELIKNFGLPQDENYKQWYNAYNYLKYQDSLDVIRPLSTAVVNKKIDLTENIIPVPNNIANFYNSEVADLEEVEQENNEAFTVIEKYCNSSESLAVVICSNSTTWKNPVTDEFIEVIINDDITDPSTILSLNDGDAYIVKEGAIGDWSGEDGKRAVWVAVPGVWSFYTVSEGDSIYNSDDELEYYKSSGVLVERATTLDYIIYDSDTIDDVEVPRTYIRQTYTTIQDSDGVVKKCSQLMTTSPDFDNGEFAVFVFKINSLNLFDLVERFTCSISSSSDIYYDTVINGVSNYIYLKYVGDTNYDNTGFSLMNSILVFDDDPIDFLNVLPADYQATIDEVDFDDYNIVINCEIDSSQAYIPTACIDTSCLCITSAWNEYDTVTDLINEFGIYATTPTGYTIFDKNNIVIGNWKKQYDTYNDKKRIQPFAGDVAGYILDNSATPDWNDCFELSLFGLEDITLLRENKINLAQYYNDYKNFFTLERYKPKFKYGYNVLIHHKIEKAIDEIINNSDNTYRPPFERYKDRIQVPIVNYLNGLINVDIDGFSLDITLNDENVITFTITITYFMVIESIIVNFTATIGNLSESMYMSYKDK